MRWKVLLAFLLIIGLSFAVTAGTLTNMLRSYLFEQKIASDRAGVEKWTVQAAPFLYAADTGTLSAKMAEAGRELGGRMLVLDKDAKVQTDTFYEANGRRLDYPEVASILMGGIAADHGIYSLSSGEKASVPQLLRFGASDDWVSYSTAGVVHASDVIGVILLVTSAREMMHSLQGMQDNTVLMFAVVASTAILAGMLFSRIITRPVVELTSVIRRMARGDFAARVPERGSGELRQLAVAFNSMSEKLETLDDARNMFISNASHELKTPLATMKIMIESLVYQPEMEQELRTEFLSDVNTEIDRLSAIVSDLLTLVQADAHSMKLEREKMSLAAIVKEASHRLQPLVDQKQQQLALSLLDSCDMYADRVKLQQVVYNLMENAVKYTQDGGKINVTLARVGRDAVLTVADNGPGIPAEHLSHVFDRFYRVDRARSRESGGTGLGLSIAREIVSLHGGQIRAESEEDEGTTFVLELPLNKG